MTADDTYLFVEERIRRGRDLMHIGELDRAEIALLHARAAMIDAAGQTDGADLLPRLLHREAQLRFHQNRPKAARRRFEASEHEFDESNLMGRAMAMRDHGWMLWLTDERIDGTRLIEEACDLLVDAQRDDEFHWREFVTTEGFLARTFMDKEPGRAREQFELVDAAVRGEEPMAEYDNLTYFIRTSPLHKQPLLRIRQQRVMVTMIAGSEFRVITNGLLEDGVVTTTLRATARNVRRLLPL